MAKYRTAVADGVASVSVLCCAAVVVWHPTLDTGPQVFPLWAADLTLGTVWPIAGAVVARHAPRNPVGRLLLAAGIVGPYLLAGHYAVAADRLPGYWPGAGVAAWFASWGFAVYFLVFPLVPMLFPTGRPASPAWRIAVGLLAANAVAAAFLLAVAAPTVDQAVWIPNPWAIAVPVPVDVLVAAAATLALPVAVPLALVSTVLRTRRASGADRTRLQWLLLGTVVQLLGVVCAGVVGGVDVDPAGPWATAADVGLVVAVAGPPLGIAVAMARFGLFDVQRVLGRTVVYAVLSAAVVGAYVLVVWGAQLALPGSTAGVVVVAVVALAAAAGRDRLQHGVERLLYGDRRDPYVIVTRVGGHVAAASEPVEGLQRLVDGVRDTLGLPFAAFRAVDGTVLASAGDRGGAEALGVPARMLGRDVGELLLVPPGPRFEQAEQDAAQEVAARAAALAYAAELVGDVARSREAIVLARGEERRRLRDDLHDGLGPTLAGTAHQLDALARRASASGEQDLAARAEAARDRLRDAVRSLRGVVHGLRPPVLDQVGLAPALRGLVDDLDVPAGRSDVGDLGTVPAAVEVAALAVAGEAVTNAVRHSGAGNVELRAGVRDGVLCIEVRDDGCGLPTTPTAGVGLASMAERAAEVGGRVRTAPVPGGGTAVRAELPVIAP